MKDKSKKKKEKIRWIIVKNKKTYLFIVGIISCILFLIIDAFCVFVFKQKDVVTFVGDIFMGVFISIIFIYLFVRFNTYSAFYNPNHPKSEKDK